MIYAGGFDNFRCAHPHLCSARIQPSDAAEQEEEEEGDVQSAAGAAATCRHLSVFSASPDAGGSDEQLQLQVGLQLFVCLLLPWLHAVEISQTFILKNCNNLNSLLLSCMCNSSRVTPNRLQIALAWQRRGGRWRCYPGSSSAARITWQ